MSESDVVGDKEETHDAWMEGLQRKVVCVTLSIHQRRKQLFISSFLAAEETRVELDGHVTRSHVVAFGLLLFERRSSQYQFDSCRTLA